MRISIILVVALASLLIFGCISTGTPNTTSPSTNSININETTPNPLSTTTVILRSLDVNSEPNMTMTLFMQSILTEDPGLMASTFSPSSITNQTNSAGFIAFEIQTRGVVGFENSEIKREPKPRQQYCRSLLGQNDEYPMVFALDNESGDWYITPPFSFGNATYAQYCYEGTVTPPTGPTNCNIKFIAGTYVFASYSECNCLYEFPNGATTAAPASNQTIEGCKEAVAIRYQDLAGCGNLTGQDFMNDCYQNIATNTNDSTVCAYLNAVNTSSITMNQSTAQKTCISAVQQLDS